MRVLMLSKACITGAYQTKLSALAAMPGIDLTVVVPPYWQDERGRMELERLHTEGYAMIAAPPRWNGHFHLHYYPDLPQLLKRVEPDILHIDEEPYNLATFHAARTMHRLDERAKIIFFAWQNILRRYPPPFPWMERFVFRLSVAAIAGSLEAKEILEAKGFEKEIAVIPQFGVPGTFSPQRSARANGDFIIGYAGRLVQEKGVHILLQAAAQLQGAWHLRILGSGPENESLQALASALGIAPRVEFLSWVDSRAMPHFYNSLDVLVVPSLTRPNWKEQFGRVLMEAMATGIPVVGSASGEIPFVVGDAGLIVPENDANALTRALNELKSQPVLREQLAQAGRTRALEKFSERQIVNETWEFYQSLH